MPRGTGINKLRGINRINRFHIYPILEEHLHRLDGYNCFCLPEVERHIKQAHDAVIIIIHNRFEIYQEGNNQWLH